MSEIPEIPEIPLFKKEILEKRAAVQSFYVMINIFRVSFPYTYGIDYRITCCNFCIESKVSLLIKQTKFFGLFY